MSDCSRAARLGRLVQGPSVFSIRFSVRTDNTLVIFDLAVLQYMSVPKLYTCKHENMTYQGKKIVIELICSKSSLNFIELAAWACFHIFQQMLEIKSLVVWSRFNAEERR